VGNAVGTVAGGGGEGGGGTDVCGDGSGGIPGVGGDGVGAIAGTWTAAQFSQELGQTTFINEPCGIVSIMSWISKSQLLPILSKAAQVSGSVSSQVSWATPIWLTVASKHSNRAFRPAQVSGQAVTPIMRLTLTLGLPGTNNTYAAAIASRVWYELVPTKP
jgi:hypothetical protein